METKTEGILNNIFENLSQDENLLDLKKTIAKQYIEQLKQDKKSLMADIVFSDPENLENFLISEGFGDELMDNVKGKLYELADPEFYEKIKSIRNKINNIKTKEELEFLHNELITIENPQNKPENKKKKKSSNKPEKKKDETQNGAVENKKDETSKDKKEVDPMEGKPSDMDPDDWLDLKTPTFVIPNPITSLDVGDFEYFDIQQADIDYINKEKKEILNKIEIKEDVFANISKVEDSMGNVILKCPGKTPYINKNALDDIIKFSLLFYKKTGNSINITSSYRTFDHQTKLIQKNKASGVPTAPVGYSGHNLGLSIDVNNSSRYNNEIGGINGFKKMAQLFNFNPISSEDWHFDHEIFVDKYYNNRDARYALAKTYDEKAESFMA